MAIETQESVEALDPRQQPHADRVLTDALVLLVGHLELTQHAVADVIGVSRSRVSQIMHGQKQIKASRKEGEQALLLVRLYRSLVAILGNNIEQARLWMSAENRALGGKPKELIRTTRGLVHVCDYLDAMRGA